jgi:hypothetical protein
VKDTNPKDAIGVQKTPTLSVVPLRVLAEVSVGMLEGACKYARHNYRAVGVRASVYMDATGRHLFDWWEGQDIDPASGISHISKAIASLVVLRDSMMQGNWIDDRPPSVEPGWMDKLNEQTKAVLAKYPDPKPPYTNESLKAHAALEETVL